MRDKTKFEQISETDLILNPDGSVYHLNLLPDDLAPIVITVGDQERVPEVSKHFDKIELVKGKREFITHTGYYSGKRVSVVSTGIGTDNIDIVLNELDALVNIDFETRRVREELTRLEIIRIGTSGTIQKDISPNTILISEFSLGLDALMGFYRSELSAREDMLQKAVGDYFGEALQSAPYVAAADTSLLERIGEGIERGFTVTAPGFYGPQGRHVRAAVSMDDLIERLSSFRCDGLRISNLEMETAGIYALAKVLGHRAVSVNAILASRVHFEFSSDPQSVIEEAIHLVLSRI